MKIPYSDEFFKVLWLHYVIENIYYSDLKVLKAKYRHKIHGPELYTEEFEFLDRWKNYNAFWEELSVIELICTGTSYEAMVCYCDGCWLSDMINEANLTR